MRQLKQETSSDNSSDQQRKGGNKKKKIPTVDPLNKIKIKSKKLIYVNLSMTRYEVIADVVQELGWVIQYSADKGDWDVLWTDHAVDPQILIKMHLFQKISHFPGIHILARKNLLGFSLMQMKKKFPSDYDFFPQTWMLPTDYPQFRLQIENKKNDQKVYIVKPQADCQGRGIFLTKKIQDVENGKHYVVQEYIMRPYLIQGLKFDFRVYVLLCGTNPMRLYVYQQGLARFATEKYVEPNDNNMKKQYIHLTNYAINKKNPKYVYNSSVTNMGIGHKRSLTSVFKYMERRGDNIELLKTKMYDMIVKTFILGLPLVSHQYKFCQPQDQHRNMCFHILGIDIMLDSQCNPILLEVNHTPSFATDTPLDYKIKSNLIRDTLTLMNVNIKSKSDMILKAKQIQKEKQQNGKRKLFQNNQKRQRVKQAQNNRDIYQNQHMGKYIKIYPTENQFIMEKYQMLIQDADRSYFAQNNVLRAQIQIQKHNAILQEKKNSVKLPSPPKMNGKTQSYSERVKKERDRTTSGQSIFIQRSKKSGFNGLKSFGSCKMESIKMEANRQVIYHSVQPEPTSNCVRISLIKRLPRLQSTSSFAHSGTLQIRQKRQFLHIKKKKILDYNEMSIKDVLLKKFEGSPGKTCAIKPINIQFKVNGQDKKQDEQILDEKI